MNVLNCFVLKKIEINKDLKKLTGYLLLDFKLNEPLQFEYFTIEPAIEVRLPGAYAGFIAQVSLPKWFEWHDNPHLFTVALSAVFSFVSGRPVKAPRDGYNTDCEHLSDYSLCELAIQFPVLTAGPGSHGTRISEKGIGDLYEKLNDFITLLFKLKYNDYKKIMRSIRLVHLANNNVRDDFALSYYLLVSSIESAAQLATKVSKFREYPKNKGKWEEIAENNDDVKELLEEYKKERSQNNYIKERFVYFIKTYCPYDKWDSIENSYEDYKDYISYLTRNAQEESLVKKWFEKYPSDLPVDYLDQILRDMYTYRSKFTHQGVNPPHQNVNNTKKFFEEITEYDKTNNDEGYVTIKKVYLPNIRLISFIARESILNYFKTKV